MWVRVCVCACVYKDVLEERGRGRGGFGRNPPSSYGPLPTLVPEAPEFFFKVKYSCAKGTEEIFASNSGRGGGGGSEGGGSEGGGGGSVCVLYTINDGWRLLMSWPLLRLYDYQGPRAD